MSEQTNTKRDLFARVLPGILRPLVRAMIARGITAQAFHRMMKRLYIEVAETEYSLDGTRQTDSRISVLTGIHRRDVKELRSLTEDADAAVEEKVAIITSVIGRWLASEATTDKTGGPVPLPRSGGDGTSFESLVASISKDVRPRTLLDEMFRQELIRQDDDGMLHLLADAFVGPEDLEQRVFFFGENVGDHIAAATDNLLAEDPSFMERAVFYNRLTAGSVDKIEDAARSGGITLLGDLNKLAHEHQKLDVDSGLGDERFRFGVFFYRTKDGPEDETQTDETQTDDDNDITAAGKADGEDV
ncbi:MAG: DUF6502 family protein [Pseudomonadota bacterium]